MHKHIDFTFFHNPTPLLLKIMKLVQHLEQEVFLQFKKRLKKQQDIERIKQYIESMYSENRV